MNIIIASLSRDCLRKIQIELVPLAVVIFIHTSPQWTPNTKIALIESQLIYNVNVNTNHVC